jgi:predicted HAD superfamily phosphohydrolase
MYSTASNVGDGGKPPCVCGMVIIELLNDETVEAGGWSVIEQQYIKYCTARGGVGVVLSNTQYTVNEHKQAVVS